MRSKGLFESLTEKFGAAVYPEKRAIVDFISGEVYRDPLRYGFDSADDAADALLRYRSRIDVLIDRYLQCGHPYDRYIETSLLYMAKSIRRENRKVAEKEFVCECPELWQYDGSCVAGFSDSCLTISLKAVEHEQGSRTPNRDILAAAGPRGRRLVYLFLKCVLQTSDSDLNCVAVRAGVPAPWLSHMVASIRFRMEGERLRFGNIAESRNAAWVRIYNLEARLCREFDPERRKEMTERLVREKERYAGAQSRVMRFNPTVPNSVISLVLGVPKGTIDSGLYYMKRHSALSLTDKTV